MVYIKDVITLKFKFGELEDFLNVLDLVSFMIVEDTGGSLPTFKLIFKTSNEKVLRYLNEGAVIEVSFGGESLETDTVSLVCISSLVNKTGSNSFLITVIGIYDALDYLVKPQLGISSAAESALEALETVVSQYFTVDFDPETSEDSQIYIQPNITDKKFTQHLLSQAKLSSSAPISGITFDGFFRVRDIKSLAATAYSWKFTKDIKDKNKDINYETGDTLEGSSGMINSLYGYGRLIYELNFDSGESSINTATSSSVFSNSSAPSRRSSISDRMGPIVLVNENMDSDFYKTNLRNAMYNFTCSQYKKTVRFINKYRKIKVLDLVMFNEPLLEKDTLEYTSGLYVVSKVVRTISAGFFQTTCELCRESLNNPEGDNR